MINKSKISGWGNYPVIKANISKPKNLDELRYLLSKNKSAIARGNGRSYGDSSINQQLTIKMENFNKVLEFNEKKGLIKVESGILLKNILEKFIPLGWFPPVTPGTKYLTVGGMVASNVHGKNHHKVGSFSNFIDKLKIINKNGIIIECSSKKNKTLFLNTLGGMGLTGIILEVSFYLKKISSGWIKEKKIVCNNLFETFNEFDKTSQSTYSVAWIDSLAKGKNTGRSILMLGEHLTDKYLPKKYKKNLFCRIKDPKFKIPFYAPSFLLNKFNIKLLNTLYFYLNKISNKNKLTTWDNFFYPLDKILNWNKLYGKRGFIEFQCVLPLENSFIGVSELLNLTLNSKSGSFLSVLKKFGKEESLISFPMEGYTITFDFPKNADNINLVNQLYEITVKYGGRIYLTKDSVINKNKFKKSDNRFKNFTLIRNKENLISFFKSEQSKRIGI